MFNKGLKDEEASTRLQIVKYLLVSVLIVVLAVLVLSAFGIPIPEFVSGIVIMGYMTMLKDAVTSYFKAREDIQVARVETAKVEAAKEPCIPTVNKEEEIK